MGIDYLGGSGRAKVGHRAGGQGWPGNLCGIEGTQSTIQITMWYSVLISFRQLDNIFAGKTIGCNVLALLQLTSAVPFAVQLFPEVVSRLSCTSYVSMFGLLSISPRSADSGSKSVLFVTLSNI